MAFETGGMDYGIQVRDEFSKKTRLFRTELKLSSEAWRVFRKEFAKTSGASRAMRREFDEVTSGLNESSEATKRSARASREAAEEADGLTAAQRRLKRILEERQLQAETDIEAQKQNVLLTKRGIGVLEEKANIEAKIARARILFRENEAAAQQLEKEGITLSGKRIKVFNAETEAINVERKALEKRNLAAALGRKGLGLKGESIGEIQGPAVPQSLKNEIEATRQADELQQKGIIADLREQKLKERNLELSGRKAKAFDAEALAAERFNFIKQRGQVLDLVDAKLDQAKLDKSGRQIKAFDAQAKAADILRRAKEKLAVADALRAQGATAQGTPILTAQQTAVQKLTKDLERLRVALELKKLKQNSTEFQRLNSELGITDKKANSLFFTFRRLFGVFAAFAVVRAAVRGFRDLITEAIRFNQVIETSTLAVASLLTAVADVRDAQGRTVTSAQKLALAQKEARRQVALLRLDALKTAATFEQLQETFQVAVAPGFTAGLNIDEIRKLTVSISQAAAAIGLPQNQLAEEIRSLLSGTIQLRTTRIAAALGITNEDVRRAKELGVLAQFLQKRFEAFSVAGETALSTFAVILSNVTDALQQLLGAGTEDFFNNLKALLKEVQASIVDINDEGIKIDPTAVKAVKAISLGLTAAVEEARRLIQALSFKDVQGTAELIGKTIVTIVQILGAGFEGFVRGIRTLASVVNGIIDSLSSAGSLFKDLLPDRAFLRLLSLVVQIATISVSIFGTYKGLLVVIRTIIAPLTAVNALQIAFAANVAKGLTTFQALRATILSSEAALTGVVGVITAIVAALGTFKIIDQLRSLLELPKDVSLTFKGFFDGIVLEFETFGVHMFLELQKQLGLIEQEVAKQALKIRFALGFLNEEEFAAQTAGIELFQQKIREMFDLAQDLSLEIFKEKFKALGKEITNAAHGTDELAIATTKLSDLFLNLPASIQSSRESLSNLAEMMRDLTKELRESKFSLKFTIENTGLDGAVLEELGALEDARIRQRREGEQLDIEATAAATRLLSIQAQQLTNEARLSLLKVKDQAIVERAIHQGRLVQDTQAEIARQISQQGLATLEAKEAEKSLDKAQAKTARDRATQIEQTIAALKEQLKAQLQASDTILNGVDNETAQQIQKIVSDTITLEGQRVATNQQILDIKKDQLALEDKLFSIAKNRIQQIAIKETRDLALKNRELATQVIAEQRIRDLRRSILELVTDRPLREQAALTQNLIDNQSLQLRQAKELATIETNRLKALIAENALNSFGTGGDPALVQLLKQQQQLQANINLENAKQELSLKEAQRVLDEINKGLEHPIEFGFKVAIADFVRDTPDQFQNALSLMTEALNGFTQTAAQSVIGIFTGKSSEEIVAAWGQLLSRLGEQIIESQLQTLFAGLLANQAVQQTPEAAAALATSTAALEVSSSALALGAAAGAVTESAFLMGGVAVSLNSAAGSWDAAAVIWGPIAGTLQSAATTLAGLLVVAGKAEGGVIGLAGGGGAFHGKVPNRPSGNRPKGLDSRDRVNVWTRIGEYAVVPEQARRVGYDFMDKLNAGMLNPFALRALAGLDSKHGLSSAPRGPGMARGGRVSGDSILPSRTRNDQMTPTIIPKDQQAQERLMAGGKRARLNEIRQNPHEFRAALGI